MPTIISSTRLRDEYNEISQVCHEQMDSMYATRNGNGDLAAMSIEAYEALARRGQLVHKPERGRADVEARRTMPADKAVRRFREEFVCAEPRISLRQINLITSEPFTYSHVLPNLIS
ncbi:MAG: hypothetical protein MR433_05155 [Coriobacteriaceae bacterium]|nr:hypothetical protein [Coriobacteriaceae bacterium]